MWNINYSLLKLVPPEKSGYDFISTHWVLIPYREIGLNLLVRKEQELPLLYEVVLKLVECNYNNVQKVSDLTGLGQEVLISVIGEMSRFELIYLKSNSILLTPKGVLAINNLKKITIEKEQLNRIYIDTISGEFINVDNLLKKRLSKYPWIDEIVDIDDNFINSNFDAFDEYYKKRQEDYEDKSIVKNEIYQILGKEYAKLHYIEKKLYVYRNMRDNDIVYEFEGDMNNIYGQAFTRQMEMGMGARKILKRKSDVDKYLTEALVIDNEKQCSLSRLIEYAKKSSGSNNGEELEKLYFCDRDLLDKEYMEILYLLKYIKPHELLISSSEISHILNDDIIGIILSQIDNINAIHIIYNSKEYNSDKIVAKLLNHKDKSKVKIDSKKDVSETNIILYPHCAINIKYYPIKVDNDYLVQEKAEVCFNIEKVTQILNDLREYQGRV